MKQYVITQRLYKLLTGKEWEPTKKPNPPLSGRAFIYPCETYYG